MKRKDYISWDEYFMGVAILASKRSKDPNTQVGACIVDLMQEAKILRAQGCMLTFFLATNVQKPLFSRV